VSAVTEGADPSCMLLLFYFFILPCHLSLSPGWCQQCHPTPHWKWTQYGAL